MLASSFICPTVCQQRLCASGIFIALRDRNGFVHKIVNES